MQQQSSNNNKKQKNILAAVMHQKQQFTSWLTLLTPKIKNVYCCNQWVN